LFDIFRGFLESPEPLDDDAHRLLSSFERLRKRTRIDGIPSLSKIEFVSDELGRGEMFAVTLSSDSKEELSAVKTSLKPDYTDLIRREAAILKTLKHPLILQLRQDISDTPDHNSAIVTEFEGNGSLANHLPPAECILSGANRITKVIVGIALAMRFVHSRGFIHRELKPDNILLDWDWKVRIADFGQSYAPDNSNIPLLPHFNANPIWPSVDFRYLAPECYEMRYLPASDVFSFGMILYELLTGLRAFPEDPEQQTVAMKVTHDERPPIPEFVLPSARELIEDCWAVDPDDRPSFEEIVDRLAEMKFKVFWNVNSLKLLAFVKEIDEWEKCNETTPILHLTLVC
jgi:serine/threonine protein kinase